MITTSDCEAFCDADPAWVRELARRESLGMVQAYALAHESMAGTANPVMSPRPVQPVADDSGYRQAA